MMKRGILFAVLWVFLVLPVGTATLNCAIKASCAPEDVEIFGMSALSNGHAAMPGSSYAHKVCCTGLTGLANTGGTAFLNFSSATNANAGKITGATIATNAARIASSGPMNCVYQASCPSQYICLASIEKDANAHMGDCSAYPSSKICCGCADDSEITQPQFCSDGIDNDCDGLIDCQDDECKGGIRGYVENANNVKIAGASIKAYVGAVVAGSDISSDTTDNLGQYELESSPSVLGVPCGSYSLVASHFDYVPIVKNNLIVPPQTIVEFNFDSDYSLNSEEACEPDCTFLGSSIIHASCSGVNGCAFYNAAAAAACENAQPGWTREVDADNNVVCPSGPLQPKSTQRANVQCSTDICSRASTPVLYNGKQVKMVIVVAGK